MSKKEILGAIGIFIGIYIYTLMIFFAGQDYKEQQLAQELCKYTEYNFCKVKTYKILIKKGE